MIPPWSTWPSARSNGSSTFDALAARRVFGDELDAAFPFSAWLICDDPAHAWVRGAWVDAPVDARLPFTQVP